jgi:hypothetical protein
MLNKPTTKQRRWAFEDFVADRGFGFDVEVLQDGADADGQALCAAPGGARGGV